MCMFLPGFGDHERGSLKMEEWNSGVRQTAIFAARASSLRKKAKDFQFRHKHFHFFQNEQELLDLGPARLKEILRLNGLACTLKKGC